MMQKLAARQPQRQAAGAARPCTSSARAAPAPAPSTAAAPAAAQRTPAPAHARPSTAAAALLAAALVLLTPAPAAHAGLFPDRGAAKERLEQADRAFEESGTLKALLERSDQNRDKNRRAIAAKTCARQAEMGVGDCGGLRFVPGATSNGKQKTPEFLSKLLGTEGKEVQYEAAGKTLQEILAADEARAVARETEGRAAAKAAAKAAVGAALVESAASAEDP
jgi:hypothetical protein